MHKVVIERPRWNPGPAKMGRVKNLPDDLLPKVQGMRRPYKNQKAFTDLLGPLKRWLRAQVGRRWNDAYSEACEVIKPDSVVRLHIKTHLFEFVERHTFMRGGEVCFLERFSGRALPVQSRRFGREQFYVHPESGLLLDVKPESRREWRKAQRAKKPPTLKWLDARSALKRIKGIWFMCEFREVPVNVRFRAYDHALEQIAGRGTLTNRESVFLHCFSKRQLSRRELRRYGVNNAVGFGGERLLQRVNGALKKTLPRHPFNVNPNEEALWQITMNMKMGWYSKSRANGARDSLPKPE